MKCYGNIMQKNLSKLMAVALFMGISLPGCQSSHEDSVGPQVQAARPLSTSEALAVSPPRVVLVPGDVIEIKFFYTPQLNETQTVRPDGKIALQLVGEVDVHQKTPAEVRENLFELYAPYLEGIEVTVIVRSFQDRRVFVTGQVIAPGIVEIPGKVGVLEAIMQAGGFNLREAKVENVIVIRHRGDRRYGYSINLKPALTGDETDEFYLQPRDIVYVPRTRIAEVAQWIDQHINQIIPDTGIIYTRTSGNTTLGIASFR